jgi:glycosyltransferase involved in cell wall biosynthesis
MSTLSGCLVVRNGKKSVVRCLDALLPVVNEYVVIDTGSKDGTIELIKAWAGNHPNTRIVLVNVGRRFHDEDGIFDFGAAKNYAISRATCDYVMWIDVNDEVLRPREVRVAFDKITAKMPHASITMLTEVDSTFAFPRVRIAPRATAKIIGSIHEYMVNEDPENVIVTTRFRIRNIKTCRDIARNVASLMKEWKIAHTQRIAFYLGNSARDMNDFFTALDWYTVTVDEFPDSLNEERAKSIEALCDIALRENMLDILNDRSMQLINELPDRPEGYYYRAKYQYAMKNYKLAIKSLEKLMQLNVRVRPTHMWINPNIYDRHEHLEMLKEAQAKAEYSNMTPIAPCIEDANMALQNGRYVGRMSTALGDFGTPMFQYSN